MRNLLITLSSFCALVLVPAIAQATPTSHPIALAVGDDVHATGIHLRFDSQPIDQSLADFVRRGPSDEIERVAVAFFKATIDKNAVGVGRWLDRRTLKGTS